MKLSSLVAAVAAAGALAGVTLADAQAQTYGGQQYGQAGQWQSGQQFGQAGQWQPGQLQQQWNQGGQRFSQMAARIGQGQISQQQGQRLLQALRQGGFQGLQHYQIVDAAQIVEVQSEDGQRTILVMRLPLDQMIQQARQQIGQARQQFGQLGQQDTQQMGGRQLLQRQKEQQAQQGQQGQAAEGDDS